MALSHFLLEQYEKAIEMFKTLLERQPNYWAGYVGLAITYGALEKEENTKMAVKKLLILVPDYSIKKFRATWSIKNQDVIEKAVKILEKAGLPEK